MDNPTTTNGRASVENIFLKTDCRRGICSKTQKTISGLRE